MQRSEETQKRYKYALESIEGCPLCWRHKDGKNRTDDTYYEHDILLMDCEYPYSWAGNRKVLKHLMLVSKQCNPLRPVKERMLEIAESLKPDNIVINYNHQASCPEHFHIHILYTKPIYEQGNSHRQSN